MRRNPIDQNGPKLNPAEPVTWVGRGRQAGELCLGFESGKTQFVNLDLQPIAPISPIYGTAGEAINGAAWHDGLVVASSRHEVNVGFVLDGKAVGRTYQGGVHGLCRSAEGKIVGPRGSEGLLYVRRREDGEYTPAIASFGDQEAYFYQTVCLGRDDSGREVFASACRTDGLVLTPIGADHSLGPITILGSSESGPWSNLDFVSLCPLKLPGHPFSLALLGVDGSVHLSRDVRSGIFVSLMPTNPRGTPYAIQSAQGHVFILTSEQLYAVHDLARDAFDSAIAPEPSAAVAIEVDAVDCTIVDDEYLVLIEEDGVSLAGVNALARSQRVATNPADRSQPGMTLFDIRPDRYSRPLVSIVDSTPPITNARGDSALVQWVDMQVA